MKKFNWEEFKDVNNRIAVHCKTHEEAKDFCKQMHKQGMTGAGEWDYSSNTFWDYYRNNTCYGNHGTYGTTYHFNEHSYTILEWSDYMKKEFTNYDNNLINNDAKMEIVKIYNIRHGRKFNNLMENDNLELIWERKETKEMTIEEMKQKLEELTGKNIKVINK